MKAIRRGLVALMALGAFMPSWAQNYPAKPRLGPALWYTCLAGGIRGKVFDYGRESLTIKGQA